VKQNYSQVSIASVGNEDVTVEDLIFHLKVDLGQNVVDSAVHERLLKAASNEMGIHIGEEELQEAANDFRRRHRLISAQETFDWLADNGLSVEDFERKLEDDLIRERIISEVATEDAIQGIFLENISGFQRAKIGIIVVERKRVANEIIDQLMKGEADFIELALKHSILKDVGKDGGFMGNVYRNELPYAVDEVVFDEDAPMLVGPVEVGGNFYVVNVFEKANSDLDETAREICRRMLLDEFIRERSLEVGVNIHVLPEPQNMDAD
jgi:peptidylprolyl isomerase